MKIDLTTKWAGRNLHYFDQTDSTNIDAKRYAQDGAEHGTVIVADMQTNGRGRRGRMWQSPSGSAIYMTIVLKPDFLPDKASMLTLVMALSVAEAITEVTGLAADIKWPNDIVVNRKKVCGILTEMNAKQDYIDYVVIGVGINVNNLTEEFSEEIRQTATSLRIESNRLISREAVLERVLFHFERKYDIYVRKLDLSEFMEEYNKHLYNLNTEVKVLDPKGEFTGISRGINELGELLVEKEDGAIVHVYAGEVSVRGLYGYV